MHYANCYYNPFKRIINFLHILFEMKCLRSMTGVSRLDRVRNEVVRLRTGVRRELFEMVRSCGEDG